MRASEHPGRKKNRPHVDPDKALYSDALEAARQLKRKHRAIYNRDPHRFRALVKKATGHVLRLRPGPKVNTRIAQAARARASGCAWTELYARYIDGYTTMPEFTRSLAEDSLRRRVNGKLRHSRYRSRKKN
jgi:hypothetical protein